MRYWTLIGREAALDAPAAVAVSQSEPVSRQRSRRSTQRHGRVIFSTERGKNYRGNK